MTRHSCIIPLCACLAVVITVVVALGLIVSVNAEEATAGAGGEAGAEPMALPDDATLRKMRVKELKAILEKKGPDAACLACTTKQEFIDRVKDTHSWPDIAGEEGEKESDVEDVDSIDDEAFSKMFTGQTGPEMDKIMADLKAAGINTEKVFAGGKLDKEKFAEELTAKWGDKGKADAAGADGKADL